MIPNKCRGKRVDNGEWVKGYHCKVDNKHYIIIPEKATIDEKSESDFSGPCFHTYTKYLSGFVEVIPETVGQLTGRTDKDGKEIHGGDILEDGVFGAKNRYAVQWSDHFAMWMVADGMGWQAELNKYAHCKVIGNIHEHK